MTLTNAIKKIEKAGFTATHISGVRNRTFQVELPGQVLQFSAQENDNDPIQCIGVRSANDQSDPMTDYCAFTFYDNLTKALKYNA